MEEGQMDSLRETIYQQNMIMQKLHTELEEEREASATAASEALSMILRLQGEKAAEKMEACQYKRMAEEKMRHAEESLVIFEDLLYQKEMEIASLKLMVQDYTEKFSGMHSEPECSPTKLFPNSHSLSSNSSLHEKSSNRIARRSSLPVLQIKELCSQIDNIEKDVFSCRTAYSMQRKSRTHEYIGTGGSSRRSSISPDRNLAETSFYRSKQEEEVKEMFLDLHVQEKVLASAHTRKVAGGYSGSTSNGPIKETVVNFDEIGVSATLGKPPRFGEKICSSETQVEMKVDAVSTSCSPSRDSDFSLRLDGSDMSYVGSPSKADATNSVSTYDVHEIPQSEKTKFEMQSSLDDNNNFNSTGSMAKEITGCLGDGGQLLREVKGSNHGTKMLPQKRNTIEADAWPTKSCHGVDAPSCSVKKLERRLQIFEKETKAILLQNAQREKEQLKLLKEIHEQLTMMRSYINDGGSKKPAIKETWKFDLLTEAMLSFSI